MSRRPTLRALTVALSLAGCSTSDNSPPGARITNAADAATSATPDAATAQMPQPPSAAGAAAPSQTFPGGPCDTLPQTQRIRVWPWPLQEISSSNALWLDPMRGVAIDLSDPAQPRLRGELKPDDLVDLTRLTEHRMVAARQRVPYDVSEAENSATTHPDELLLLSFDDPDAPRELAQIDIPGEVALVTSVQDEAGTRVFVISDEIERRCAGPTKQSFLYTFAYEADTLTQLDKLELGDDLAVAERRADYLLLFDGTYLNLERRDNTREPSLRVVKLTSTAVPILSERAAAPFVGIMPPDLEAAFSGDILTTVTRNYKGPGLRFMRYELGETNTLRVLSDCLNEALDYDRFDASAGKLSVLGERIIVGGSAAAINDGPLTQEVIEVNPACETLQEEYQVGLIDVPNVRVAIELTASDEETLEVRLLSPAQPGITASTRVVVGAEYEIALRDNIVLDDAVAFEHEGEVERGLLGIETRSRDTGALRLQLFSFSASTITARGALLDANRLALPTASGVAAVTRDGPSGASLFTYDLSNGEETARETRAKLSLPPRM
jgi:hypothetical protein